MWQHNLINNTRADASLGNRMGVYITSEAKAQSIPCLRASHLYLFLLQYTNKKHAASSHQANRFQPHLQQQTNKNT